MTSFIGLRNILGLSFPMIFTWTFCYNTQQPVVSVVYCSVARYCHLSQKVLARLCTIRHCSLYRLGFSQFSGRSKLVPDFWVSRVAGVKMKGSVGSVDTGIKGLLFIMAMTSAIKVESTSCMSLEDVVWKSMESNILRVRLIVLSHAPPMCDEWGGLNVHVQLWSDRNCSSAFSSMLEGICKSLQALMKLVPLSERICFTGPRIAKNLLKALMKLEVFRDSITSMWTALMFRHVNSTAHLLLSANPPLVFQADTDQGPNTCSPTCVKGGSALSLSLGRSAISWVFQRLLSLRLTTQEWDGIPRKKASTNIVHLDWLKELSLHDYLWKAFP